MALSSDITKFISSIIPYKGIAQSSLGFKYPTLRDHPLHSGELWLKGKTIDDGAEGLWRVHDGLYDLTDFIEQHPGGSSWLELTKGTDITEAFEAHHISIAPEKMLQTFYIRDATTPRNSPFTFKEDGFYRNLKKNIREVINDVPSWPKTRSKIITDFLLLDYLLFAFLAAYLWSFSLGAIAGIFLTFTSIAAHNFFHQKDNFRMYYFDFTLMRSRSWRISHAMSHHMYTNTIKDLEISHLEPFFQYLPQEKHIFFKYISWLYSPIVYGSLFFGNWLTETIQCFWSCKGISMVQLLPFTIPVLMFLITGYSPIWIAIMFIWILIVGSLLFGVIGVNAAHHHPEIFHDGDTPRPKEDLDWGIYQLDAVMDRNEITGSHFLVLTNFGDHALHHLFPTIDHGVLEYLYPIFKKTCKQFDVEFRMTSQLDLICGQFRQLARIQPTLEPPKKLHKKELNELVND